MLQDHEGYMRMAMEEAGRAGAAGNRAVGSVIVRHGTVVGRGGNCRVATTDPTAHAEVTAMRNAVQGLGGMDFSECTLYTTMDPCPMCAGAIAVNKIPIVIVGGTDPETGRWGDYSLQKLLGMVGQGNVIQTGVLADECSAQVREFDAKQGRAWGGP